ncbi:MAG: histidinol-phosphate aminotransferase family protein [Desulfosarcina sp.]|nr:histidinol-phosphate aminotransferase family protein [Desulfosarcina sp.]MBC2745024.1 histidinol-phosphate aminotransferase family protein [Desulfosarcina sp.]MBC2767932.1 histidinol-phosphate aminotransferase family protein [Desulfosarcina sp.]
MLKEPIKLNMNEVAYPPSKEIIESARKSLMDLNRYSEPEDIERLLGLLADYSGVPKKHIIQSPGSDLLLREIIHTYSKGRKIVIVSPSFFPTVQAAKQFATKLISIRLSPPDFDLNPDLLLDQLNEPCLVILDNPNNPTGKILLDRKMVGSIVDHRDVLIVVDEAYYEFSGVTFADMVQEHPNLAITRTMDKAFSLAGARIGYMIAGEAFLDAFSSFYMILPRPSLCAAIQALKNPDYMRRNVCRVIAERERIWNVLNDNLAVPVYKSMTNFLLIKTDVPDMVGKLADIGILISDLSNQLPSGFIRVSIGNREENDAFITGYMKICETYSKEKF